MCIAQAGYMSLSTLSTSAAAYFPAVPASFWPTHWPLASLLGLQRLRLALLGQVGQLAAAWGLAGWRLTIAQNLVALSSGGSPWRPPLAFRPSTYQRPSHPQGRRTPAGHLSQRPGVHHVRAWFWD